MANQYRHESQGFRHLLRATAADIDAMGHVNNVVYLRWVQEVASAHWESIASPELANRYQWVVLRHEIDYRNPSFIDDEVLGTTWVGEHHGARFERYVKLVSLKNGKVLAEAKTIWCMLDAKTGRPSRIPSEVLDIL